MTGAYEAGRAAFHAGADRLSCPHPAPYNPPRTPADVGLSPGCKGAFWLDGFEAANARLIAAAHGLLAALRQTRNELYWCAKQLECRGLPGFKGDSVDVALVASARAIAKATGDQS